MGQSVLVFVSHSSEDKESYVEPIVSDLENCFINVWIDKRRIVPGDNLRKSIIRDGLDKADVALIFFTEKSLKSSWVDREIKHVLREESKKGNQFDLNKIISVFDTEDTYEEISNRYPELTDDLLHLMPPSYDKVQLGQLISAIWSKYLDLQGGDVETQRQLLEKDKEIFQKDKENTELAATIRKLREDSKGYSRNEEFEKILATGKLKAFIAHKDLLLRDTVVPNAHLYNAPDVVAFGFGDVEAGEMTLSEDGKNFFRWYILNKEDKS